MLSLISNSAAQYAQQFLKQASSESTASISRLSSGDRINKASADVAGLAIGTTLSTNVSTLKAALTNTSQANSLLGVADGALANIASILQKQKALATQATSGALSAAALGYLNEEFQSLTQEIDSIASTTNFNGINLIDGSLYVPSQITTNASANSTCTSGTISFAASASSDYVAGDQILLYLGDVAGAPTTTITFNIVTSTTGTTNPTDILLPSSVSNASMAQAFYDAIQNTLSSLDDYNPSSGNTSAQEKLALSGLDFEYTSGNSYITVTSRSAGSSYNAGNANQIAFEYLSSSTSGGSNLEVNGKSASIAATTSGTLATASFSAAVALSTGGVSGTDGDLTAGTFGNTTNGQYAGSQTTITLGSVADTILTTITPTNASTTGVNTQGISNNAAFLGTISGFQATYLEPGYVDLSITVGDYTYVANSVATTYSSDTVVRLASITDGGGYFDLQFNSTANNGNTVSAASQSDANNFAARLDKAFQGVEFFQQRTMSSYNGVGSIYPVGGTTSCGSLSGTSFVMFDDNFSANQQVQAVSIQAPIPGTSNAVISITIDGEVYQSGYDQYGNTQALGDSIATSSSIGLVNQSNPNKMLVFTNNSGVTLDISTAANAEGIQQALEEAFGLNANAGLTFQVGNNASTNIGIQLQSASTNALYLDSSGVYQSLDISTLSGANTAGVILDNAINTIVTLRANVGSLETRFNYAANELQSSIENLDAARSVFLDTDVATESTAFAQESVRLNAAISMLAQANQLQQSLLKLIS
jgi:flagellin